MATTPDEVEQALVEAIVKELLEDHPHFMPYNEGESNPGSNSSHN
jgi:hypothetical protein